jgi:hypothetical protein
VDGDNIKKWGQDKVKIKRTVFYMESVIELPTLGHHWIEAEDGEEIDLNQPEPVRNDAISLSGAMNDAGMFEYAYREERFLPFEGVGAISSWKLDLPSSIRSFDYDTIADVLFHLDYTALDGDRDAAEINLANMINDHAANSGLFAS